MRIFPEYYIIFTFTDKYLKILERFCVSVNSVYRCNATPDIMDELWLRDASYSNTALMKRQDSNILDFLGQRWRILQKDQRIYWCLASISMIIHEMG